MTNYELVYGKQKTNSSSQNTPSPAEYKTVSSSTAEIDSPIPEQQHNAMQDAVGFIKSDNTKQKLGALSSKLKNVAEAAASTASGLAKSAVGTAKSEETSSKIVSFKEKAQSAVGGIGSSVSGVGNKASELLTSHKNNGVTESDALVSDNYNEDTINKVSNIPIFQEEPYHSQTKQTYNYSPTNENSSKKPIIIGIIAGLSVCAVFTAGLLGGQHLMKNNKNNNTPPDNNDIPVQVTDSQQTEKPDTTTVVQTTTVPVTEKISEEANNKITTEEKTQAPTVQTVIDKNAIKTAYIDKLTEFTKTEDYDPYNHISKYALYDINNDGIEELIIQYATMVGNAEKLYQYQNEEYVEIARCSESSFEICPEEHCVQWYGYGGYISRSVLSFGNQGNTIDEMHAEISPYELYILNDIGISKTEYEKINSKYDAMNWVTPAFYKFDNILPNDVANYSPKKYTIYDTSAAGSNFSFFNEPYSRKIITKKDPLNLRSAPSTSAEIILTIPKDSFVLLYGSNNGLTNDIEWSYISYTKNGTTYYGYAASEYIGIP